MADTRGPAEAEDSAGPTCEVPAVGASGSGGSGSCAPQAVVEGAEGPVSLSDVSVGVGAPGVGVAAETRPEARTEEPPGAPAPAGPFPRALTGAEVARVLAVPGNSHCADCSAMAPGPGGGPQRPTWASVNLGVVLSAQAAGVHRKLGAHVSKVLSLTLDDWTEEDYESLVARGNEEVNSRLESDLGRFPGVHKPDMSAAEPDVAYLERFVRAKYELGAFEAGGAGELPPGPEEGSGEQSTFTGAMVDYSGMLMVRVRCAHDLPAMDLATLSDPYVVLELDGEERRTKHVSNTRDPEWEETLPFNVRSLGGSLRIRVMDYDAVGSDDALGTAEVPLGSLPAGVETPVELPLTGTPAPVRIADRLRVACRCAMPQLKPRVELTLTFTKLA